MSHLSFCPLPEPPLSTECLKGSFERESGEVGEWECVWGGSVGEQALLGLGGEMKL